MFKLLTNYEVKKKMNELGLPDESLVQITENHSFNCNVKDIMLFLVNKNIGKYFNREMRSLEIKEPTILTLISYVIREELISDITNTIEIYKEYIKEKNIELFLKNSIGNIAVEDLIGVIIEKLSKKHSSLNIPISFIYRKKEDRVDMSKDLKKESYRFGTYLKKELFFIYIENKINEKNQNESNIFEEVTDVVYDDIQIKETCKNIFNSGLSFENNLNNFVDKYPIFKLLNLDFISDGVYFVNDKRSSFLEYKTSNGKSIKIYDLELEETKNRIHLITSKENPNILGYALKESYNKYNCE